MEKSWNPHERFEWDEPEPLDMEAWEEDFASEAEFDGELDDGGPLEDEVEALEEHETGGRSAVGLSRVAVHDLHPGRTKKLRPLPWRHGVYGLLVHQTGRGGLWKEGLRKDGNPRKRLQRYYNSKNAVTFINSWGGVEGGDLVQMVDERTNTVYGVGLSNMRPAVQNGSWERKIKSETLRHWRARWPGYANPLALLPRDGDKRAHPNKCYLQVECVPCAPGRDAPAPPMRPGLRFTTAQHDAIAALAVDIADRHGWLEDRWWRTPRLLGHEDVSPVDRDGWDPGWLRDKPYFDWDYVYDRIEGLWRKHGTTGWLPRIIGKAGDQMSGLGSAIGNILENGQEIVAVQRAIASGERDENELTDIAFYAAHPERNGRRIAKHETEMIRAWRSLREKVVRPLLRAQSEIAHEAEWEAEANWLNEDEAFEPDEEVWRQP